MHLFAVADDARRIDRRQYIALRVVPHKDLPRLAALLVELTHVLLAVMRKTLRTGLERAGQPTVDVDSSNSSCPVRRLRV